MLPATTIIFLLSLTAKVAFAENQPCLDIPTETHFKIEDVEGSWFPTDIVRHRNDNKINGIPLDSECPMVTFTVSPKNKKSLTMVWNATDGNFLMYTFNQKGGSRGQWQSGPEQHGSMATEEYRNFGGIIRLVKLDEKYAFFTFCSKKQRVLSTLALSRTGETPRDLFDETLAILESHHHIRAEHILINPCGADSDDSAHLLMASFFLTALPTLVTWFRL